jgi:hypothetical protein
MVCDHIDAFARYSRHRIYTCSRLHRLPPALDLDRFDAVIVHYSIFVGVDAYLGAEARARLARFTGVKAVFIQDEYRSVNDTIAGLKAIGAHIVFTCVPEAEIPVVYAPHVLPGVRFVNVLTGSVPEELIAMDAPAWDARPIDIGYRGRRYPAWHGELGRDRWRIGELFLQEGPRFGLRCDISSREEDRVYGARWIAFLQSCKAVLGTESGAGVFDFDGSIARGVEAHLDRYPGATYEELRELFFGAHEGRIDLAQISPRCFEAAALRTLLILYEGRYSGVLEPWRHYVPLRRDHANIDEVLAILRDPAAATAIVDRAYHEVARNPRYSYASFMAGVDRVLDESITPAMRATRAPYGMADFVDVCGHAEHTTMVTRTRRRLWRGAHNVVNRYVLPLCPSALRPAARRALRNGAARVRRLRDRLTATRMVSR